MSTTPSKAISVALTTVEPGDVFEEVEQEVLERFTACDVENGGKLITAYRAKDGTVYIDGKTLDENGYAADGKRYLMIGQAQPLQDEVTRHRQKLQDFMKHYGSKNPEAMFNDYQGRRHDHIRMDDAFNKWRVRRDVYGSY